MVVLGGGLPPAQLSAYTAEDREFLNRFLDDRDRKIINGQRLIAVCILLLLLTLGLTSQKVILPVAAKGIVTLLSVTVVVCGSMAAEARHHSRLVKADLEEDHLKRYESRVGNGQGCDLFMHLLRTGLMKNDPSQIQVVEVLPISKKIHRVNHSLIWTWLTVDNRR